MLAETVYDVEDEGGITVRLCDCGAAPLTCAVKVKDELPSVSGPVPPPVHPLVTVLPVTSTTTGMVNPLLAALDAETVTEPVFKPLHNPVGFMVSVKDDGVVGEVKAPT